MNATRLRWCVLYCDICKGGHQINEGICSNANKSFIADSHILHQTQ